MSLCLIIALTLLLTLGSGCEQKIPVPPPRSSNSAEPKSALSHRRMISRLEILARQAEKFDPYFQSATLESAEQAIQKYAGQAPTSVLAQLYLSLAQDYRRFGRNQEALAALEEAKELVTTASQQQSPDMTRWSFEFGLTWLRSAETANCLCCENGETCLLPVGAEGIHRDRHYSQNALKYFLDYLEQSPEDRGIIWLANIAAMTAGEYPNGIPQKYRIPLEVFQDPTPTPRFRNIAADAGLDIVNCGGGAVAEDFDGDGFIDLMTSTWEPAGQIRLFRNLADGTFQDVTAESGLTGITGGINLIPGDFDNDGRIDVFVARGAWLGEQGRIPNSLLHNLGELRFVDVAFDTGIGNDELPTCTAAWADIDLDGDLDLYVGNEGPASGLYLNRGSDGFIDIAASAGVENSRFTKAVSWGDYNNDGFPDLYVSNLNSKNRLYRNEGNLTFTDVALEVRVTEPSASFPAWFWDVNNDGNLDIFAAAYEVSIDTVGAQYLTGIHSGQTAKLYLGDGQGGFTESARQWNLNFAEQPMGSNFGDINNDGFPDFYLGTGYPEYEALMPNLMFLNQQGRKFRNITFAAGLGHLQKGHGTTFADFDNDGDQDIFMEMGGALPGDVFSNLLFENPGTPNRWTRISLRGKQANYFGVGARIRIQTLQQDGSTATSHHLVSTGGAFGANPISLQAGLGSAVRIVELAVNWPSQSPTQIFRDLPTDCELLLTEGSPDVVQRMIKPGISAKNSR